MGVLKGDFISFSFNGVHSSDLGIVRTSDGSRFNKNLLPTIQDKTVQVPGADGTYFFDSFYTQKPFTVPIAFDSLTEEQLIRLNRHFGDKNVHELIFDEQPYKVYMAKVTGTPQIKSICFDEYDPQNQRNKRVYKGEGTLNFVCYFPYARSRFKYFTDYNVNNIPEWKDWPTGTTEGDLYNPGQIQSSNSGNTSEWLSASGIMPQVWRDRVEKVSDNYNPAGLELAYQMYLYNPGDIETDCKLYFPILLIEEGSEVEGAMGAREIRLFNDDSKSIQCGYLRTKRFIKKNEQDVSICINSKTNLITGINAEGKETGSLYNDAIEAGDFFKIKLGEPIIRCNAEFTIEYDYLYY